MSDIISLFGNALGNIGNIGGGITILVALIGWMTKKWRRIEMAHGVRESSIVPLTPDRVAAPSQTELRVRHRRRLFNYPILAYISIPSVTLYLATSIPLTINHDLPMFVRIIYYITSLIGTGTWIYTIVRTIQLRRWGWLIGMVLSAGDGAPIFSIWGPTTRRGQAAPLMVAREMNTVMAQIAPPKSAPFPPLYRPIQTHALPYQPAFPHPTMPRKANGLSIAGLALGIIGILVSWFPLVDIPCPILAIIFGHIGLSQVNHARKTQHGGGLAIAGFVLGYIGLLISIGFLIYYFATPS